MSDLYGQLSAAFAEGHKRDVPDLLTDIQFVDEDNLIDAAVLIAITDKASRPGILLTQRPQTMRDHPGQVAFPGGKLETGEDAVTAALREAHEELSITSSSVSIIGTSDLYHTGTGFRITPVIGVVPQDMNIRPDPKEVESWFEAPVELLLDRSNWTERTAQWKGQQRRYLDMQYKGYRIWGVTAAILANLSQRIALEQIR